jgi:hypothetical protein
MPTFDRYDVVVEDFESMLALARYRRRAVILFPVVFRVRD